MRFDGKSGMKPSAQARRYIYTTLANFLEDDAAHDAWVLGPLDDEFDRRRARTEARKVVAELRRKAKSPAGRNRP
ncbi:MAG TPA: hypothetical protein VGU73_09665 [Acidimicrobiia bacterium]|nr:hypothetical protein [Acidimicrobiia bacterium]